MESFVRDLKKEVQCSLCNDTLTEPKIVSCFHTFCKPCIKRHAELIDEVNVFKCPRCKSQTFLPELNSVEDLHPSPLHSKILKGLALVEGEKVCSVSESHSSASWYCFDCNHSLCQECEKHHSFFTKDHKVVRLDDLKKEDIELIITRENPCTSHPQHRLEFFCEDCDAMICKTCLTDHRNHKTMTLDEFRSMKKSELSKHLEILEQLRSDDKAKQQQEKIAYTIKQQGERAKLEVIDTNKQIIRMLQESQQELLRKIDAKLDQATVNLNIIHHIPAVKEYIKNVMERGLASEKMNVQDTRCFNHIPLSSKMEFLPNQNLFQQVNSGLGEIRTCSKTDPTKSTIEVKSVTEALKKEKLTCTIKTSTGELNANPKDVIDVQIKPEKNVKMEKKYVRRDGKVEVEFMAKVQVNGNRVSNSPLVVNVRPQVISLRPFDMTRIIKGARNLRGIAVNRDNSRIAVACAFLNCIYVFTIDGHLLLKYRGQSNAQGKVSGPEGLAFLNNTDLVIADWGNHRICILNTATGTLVKTFGKQGNRNGEFHYPRGVHVDDHGHIIVCDKDNHRVQLFTEDGVYQYQFGLTQSKFSPFDVIAHDGLFYVSDNKKNVIHVFGEKKMGNVPTRKLTIVDAGSADGPLDEPRGLAIDNDHHLLVCDCNRGRVQKFTLDGRFVGASGPQVMEYPQYITVLKDGKFLVSSVHSDVWCIK